jgi:hypothetical protein
MNHRPPGLRRSSRGHCCFRWAGAGSASHPIVPGARGGYAQVHAIQMARRSRVITTAVFIWLALASCGGGTPAGRVRRVASDPSVTHIGRPGYTNLATTSSASRTLTMKARLTPLPKPTDLVPFGVPAARGEGVWRAAGRRVEGIPAVYETTLVPPGGSQPAGIAWMDTHLLSALLYSGSVSPGGGPTVTRRPFNRRARGVWSRPSTAASR